MITQKEKDIAMIKEVAAVCGLMVVEIEFTDIYCTIAMMNIKRNSMILSVPTELLSKDYLITVFKPLANEQQ